MFLSSSLIIDWSFEVLLSIRLVPNDKINGFLEVVNGWIVDFDQTNFLEVEQIGKDFFGFCVVRQILDVLLDVCTGKGNLILFGVVEEYCFLLLLRFLFLHLTDVIWWSEFSHTLDSG